jgi:hypothetical protein
VIDHREDSLDRSIESWQRWTTGDAYARAGLSPDGPLIDPLAALAANRRAIQILLARRVWAVAAAREAGASWAEIGDVLGMEPETVRWFYTVCLGHRPEHQSALAS